jgi:preprotein translocase subunit SecE
VKDKQGMAAAATTTDRPEGGPRGREPEHPQGAPSRFSVHKPGEGYATRLGMMVVLMAYAAYACHHWFYNWVFIRDFLDAMVKGTFLGILTNWMYDPTATRYCAGIGTAVLAIASFLTAYYYIYIKRRSAEFLIRTDGELGKVTWPRATPWFRAETQVWGVTYVVLFVIAVLTLYVFGIDLVLQWIANNAFYGHAR